MTPEQRELLLKLQMCSFNTHGTQYVFQTHSTFPFYDYKREFRTLAEAIDHAKEVLLECGGHWDGHPHSQELIPWIEQHIETGCTVEFVTDPERLRAFMLAKGVENEMFKRTNNG